MRKPRIKSKIAQMKKERDNWSSMAPDALLGYSTLVLGSLCFMIVLVVVVAIVRLIIGMGAA